MIAQDFLIDELGEITIVDGDFAIGYSDEQHIEDLLLASPGHYKETPLAGVDLRQSLNGEIDGKVRTMIYLQLEADGFTVNQLEIDSENFLINANRNG